MSKPSQVRVLQRTVFPYEPDQDVLALYAEGKMGSPLVDRTATMRSSYGPAEQQDPAQVLGRRSYAVQGRERTSFGTYFNAFAAGYWRRWTTVVEVTLRVVVSGEGTVIIYRSSARGNIARVKSEQFSGAKKRETTFDLPLGSFADGGMYWFDIIAGEGGATLESAQWETESDRPQGTVSIGITTLNRPDDVVTLLGQYGSDAPLMEILDAVTVVDQGAKHPDDAEGFAEAEKGLGGRLRMIRQANLGGSGGFSRGMSETVDAGVSTYHLISDDDVRAEPEGILRAVTFADLARRPLIVGGQMFSMYDRTFLHSAGEKVNPWRFMWGPAIRDAEGIHLNETSLRTTPLMHRRIDVDYNGWWMTLVPTDVIRRLGLSLPIFIKWDDAEFGLRAKAAGIPTVTLPGAAVWHVPWADKDDTLDWQAYYHERNKFAVALLYSPFEHGGRVVRESLYHQLKHLVASQYSVAELRLQALEDLLSGPGHMHPTLDTQLPKIRQVRGEYDDSRIEKEPDSFPTVKRAKVSKKGEIELPEGRLGTLAMAAIGVTKAMLPVKAMSRKHPESEVAAMDAKWWLLAQFDSAVVSLADGSGASWYKRQPEEFRRLLARSVAVHRRLLQEWPELSKVYRDALPELVSQDSWKKTFARTSNGE